MAEHRLPLFLLAAIVLFGGYLRLVDLQQANFNGDELNHYYAALSLESGDEPVLPSGAVYDRGIDISRLVGVSLRFISPEELAARIPSALFGIVNLVIIAFVAWKMAGPWCAVWATLLMAIYPQAIVLSRMTRFYTLQLNYGLLAMLTGWYAVRTAGQKATPSLTDFRQSWLWGIATAVLLLMAARIQLTTLSVMLGWLACVLAAAGTDLVVRGWRAWRRSFSVQATAVGLAIAMVGILAFRGSLLDLVGRSQYVAAWSGRGHVLSYYYMLSDDIPLIISLLPAIFLVALLKKPRLAVYLGIWFSVPVLLHSIVFPWKGERYILLALPAMFIVTGMAASAASGLVFRTIRQRLEQWPAAGGHERLASGLVTGLVAIFAIITTSAFNQARRIPPIPKAIDWTAAAAIIDSIPGSESLAAGSSIPLPALHYWGRVDFVVGTDFLEKIGAGLDGPAFQAEGGPDYYAGAPTLVSPERIQDAFGGSGAVIIGIDTDRWRFNNVDPELRDTLERDGVELCDGRCGDLYLFLWEFENDEPHSTSQPDP